MAIYLVIFALIPRLSLVDIPLKNILEGGISCTN